MANVAFIMGSNGPLAFGQLKYATKDAQRMADVLSQPHCGFDVRCPTDVSDVHDLRRQLYKSASACKADDTFLCYFSGHGVLDRGDLYLIWDNTESDFFATGLPAQDVVTALKRCNAKNKLLILDCCHAGGATGLKGVGIPIEDLQIAQANHLILMASDRLEQAREFDEYEGSFLCSAILKALGANFYEADEDKDSRVSIQDLMVWLEQSAADHNRRNRLRVPQPYLFGQRKGQFFLTKSLEWKPYQVGLPDLSAVIILPVAPMETELSRKGTRERNMVVGIGKSPVTNGQYRAFLKSIGSKKEPMGYVFCEDLNEWVDGFRPWQTAEFSDDDKPVVCVSYQDALKYCKWVEGLIKASTVESAVSGLDPNLGSLWKFRVDVPPYRLWNFAAFGLEHPKLRAESWLRQTEVIHHKDTSPASLDKLGLRTNERGISDLIGNVWEWCGERGWQFHQQLPRNYAKASHAESGRIQGGGFSDDLSVSEPFLRISDLEEGLRARLSDLGFRVAVTFPIDFLPRPIADLVEVCEPVDWGSDFYSRKKGVKKR